MNEKDIFNLVDDISEEGLNMIMNKEYTKEHIDNSTDNNYEKEIILAKLHNKIKRNKGLKVVLQENISSDKDVEKLDDIVLNFKGEPKR